MKKTLLLLSSLLSVVCCMGQAPKANSHKSNSKTKTEVKTIQLTKSEFLTKVVNYEVDTDEWKYLGDKPAIIDFYASWCGPCKILAPILEELAVEYGDSIYIYKVDTEKEKELAATFGIRAIPTLWFVPMEGMPQMATGALSKERLIYAINKVLFNKDM